MAANEMSVNVAKYALRRTKSKYEGTNMMDLVGFIACRTKAGKACATNSKDNCRRII